MQGFKKPGGDHLLKELAYVPVEVEKEPIVLLFKASFKWEKLNDKYRLENIWLTNFYHGLKWNSGDFEYKEIGNILREDLSGASRLLVNNEIKKNWLERFNLTTSVVNVAELGYSISDLPKTATVCIHHQATKSKVNCALHNVKYMKKFYFCNSDEMEWEDVSDS